MEKQKLPETIQTRLNEWCGAEITPLHFWNCDNVYYIVVRHDGDLYFLRLWFSVFSNKVELSQDNIIFETIS